MKKYYVPLPVRPDADSSFINNKIYDIPYASVSSAQKLDLYYPNDGEGPFPTIVYFHGGGFFMRDKTDDQVQGFLYATRNGYAVASCNFRLTGEAPFPAMMNDACAAVAYLKTHADELNLDPERFAAAGQSSGGYMASMLAATCHSRVFVDPELGNGDVSIEVKACVDWFGKIDFATVAEQLEKNGRGSHVFSNAPRSTNAMFFGVETDADITSEMMDNCCVLNYVTDKMPPVLVQHGYIDHLVPVQQSEELVDRIREMTSYENASFDIIADADHDDPLFLTDENIAKVVRFLDRNLK